jgi:hypothetical protein
MTLVWAFVRNLRTGLVMRREKAQVENLKADELTAGDLRHVTES